jgi:predicted RNA-binding protein with EMAP domain
MDANTLDDQISAYQQLLDALDQAYWEAADIASKDRIKGIEEELQSIIETLDQKEIKTDTALLSQATSQISAVTKELKTLQSELKTITNRIATIGEVTAAIDRVISFGTKVVGL